MSATTPGVNVKLAVMSTFGHTHMEQAVLPGTRAPGRLLARSVPARQGCLLEACRQEVSRQSSARDPDEGVGQA